VTHLLKILTIAGSDCSGGAGIQADLKTIAAHRMYGMSAITALTAQNTTGVFGVQETPSEFVAQQLDAIFTDIVPDAVKIGMLGRPELIHVIAEKLRQYGAKHIVLDPVMVSTSGSKLLPDDAIRALTEALFPLARVITPNLLEAQVLCGFPIEGEDDMRNAARVIGGGHASSILIKGGHGRQDATDLLYENGAPHWLRGERIDNTNTHGTGCTLSAAIACRLAEGRPLLESVTLAKAYLTGAIAAMLNLGAGPGPLDHGYW